jgi:predicted cobalt transporter CbtA
MTRLRTVTLLALVALPLVLTAPVLAQEEPAPTTTEAETPAEGPAPAVVVEIGEEAPESEAWTFRYLVPTLMALTGLIVVLTLVGYVLRVRARYVVKR